MKIGIPRALLYYYYYPFWKSLFENIGCELVLSDPTSAKILNMGVKNAVPEICVPMKVYIGHVLNLLEKNVDLIYIPRFISIKKGITFCPKFLGLPDMIKNSLPGLEGMILTNHIESKSDDISNYKNYNVFIEKLGVKKRNLKLALRKAKKEWLEFRKLQIKGYNIDLLLDKKEQKVKKDDRGGLTIGLLGYVYNLYDQYINLNLLDRLRQMGIKIVTFEMLDKKQINTKWEPKKMIFWQFTNKLMSAGQYFINSSDIDGIIHLTAFGCGPDSILEPFLSIDAANSNKPFMTLRIDEQTGESHILTRIEAFIDLLKFKKDKVSLMDNKLLESVS